MLTWGHLQTRMFGGRDTVTSDNAGTFSSDKLIKELLLCYPSHREGLTGFNESLRVNHFFEKVFTISKAYLGALSSWHIPCISISEYNAMAGLLNSLPTSYSCSMLSPREENKFLCCIHMVPWAMPVTQWMLNNTHNLFSTQGPHIWKYSIFLLYHHFPLTEFSTI